MAKSTEKKTEAPRAVDLVDEVRESAKAGQHGASEALRKFRRTQSMRRFLRTSNRYARQSSTPPSIWPISSSPRSTSSTAALCAARTGHWTKSNNRKD